MRVLILSQYYWPEVGAAQTRLAAFARELVGQGHEVEVLTAFPSYPEGSVRADYRGCLFLEESREGVRILRVRAIAAGGAGFGRALGFASFAALAVARIACHALARRNRPQLVFVECPPLTVALAGWIGARVFGARFALNVADAWTEAARSMGLIRDGFAFSALRRIERWLYSRADSVTTVTEGLRRRLVEIERIPAEKIRFLPNGVDTGLFSGSARAGALASDLGVEGKRVVLYAGTHGLAHGLEAALEAAKLLELRDEIRFVFLGDGSAKAALLAHAKRLGLKNAIFLPSVANEELPRYLALASCGLVTQRRLAFMKEARPAKLFPLLASGVPVVFAGEGECAALLEQAQVGKVVAPEDPRALAEAILEVLAQEGGERRAMAARARAWVRDRFEWSTLVQNWLEQDA